MLRKLIHIFLITGLSVAASAQKMPLQGEWKLFIDQKNEFGLSVDKVHFEDKILLPASLDEAGKGIKSAPNTTTSRFLRKYSFYGKAWYQREVLIPAEWNSKTIFFNMERTRVSHVWVDGVAAGSDSLLCVPQRYNLSGYLKPGKHLLTVCVDNGPDCGLPKEIGSSHMWTDETQTIWNGILGEISLEAKSDLIIRQLKTRPNISNNTIKLDLSILNNGKATRKATLEVSTSNGEKLEVPLMLKTGMANYQLVYPLGEKAIQWSEYSPITYPISIRLITKNIVQDSCKTNVGLRKFSTDGKFFSINGQPTFLRGKHDACVFPLTGYAPMNKAEWMNYFVVLKNYGFNHVRFHSWCPPEAAFEAADASGFYLQPELPFWGQIDSSLTTPVNRFLLREGKAILEHYANHPSFVMFSNGNELWGKVSSMKLITDSLRKYDNRPLFTFGTNYHSGWSGASEGEDYLISCRVGGKNDEQYESHVRSSFAFVDAKDGGILNALYPRTSKTLESGVEMTSLPVVSHETGQFEMYPDPKELSQYTGVVSPQNLDIFIRRVTEKAGAEKYKQYFDASAALSLLCYKADLEMMRRTPHLAGFEMLDLQDYPGQGTAVVGILNALMQSKGIITPSEFKQWNNDLMPLWEAGTYTWYNDSLFSGKIKISNHSPRVYPHQSILWSLTDEAGNVLNQGKIVTDVPANSLSEAGGISADMHAITKATQATLSIQLEGTEYKNSWPVWIYPRTLPAKNAANSGVRIFEQCDKNLTDFVAAGGSAILMPKANAYPQQTVGGLFTTDYWNYSMFKSISENAKKPVSPGTMGLLIDNKHPLFSTFPTETHSNWQWWPIVKNSNPLILDDFRTLLHPIVETIDNVERAHFLGLVFECKLGKGKLLVCMADVNQHLEYKENVQFYNAIVNYAASNQFRPTDELTVEQLQTIFNSKTNEKKIEGVKNVTYN